MKKLIVALVCAVALPAAANAGPFINGSFETGPTPGAFTPLAAGSTAIAGWTVGGNSIDYIGTYWNAQNGSRSIDLSGNAPGSIFQTFDTVLGQTYQVTFYLGANGDGPPPFKTVSVGATGNATGNYSVATTTFPPNVTAWSPFSYAFTATGTSTTLTFTSTGNTAYGAALDNVNVTAVPEPAAWALMIFGFGAIGGVLRRRQGSFAIA
ncbi:MAG: choice-of-anchor C family protein [Proteobacteria bacterium]|nr:choice-of-anchor C family protein [Pseudomonadota bacterium]